MARSRWRWLLLVLLLLVALPAVDSAEARPSRVDWTVEVRQGEDAKRVARTLRQLFKRASKRADWGKGGPVKLHARVAELRWQRLEDDVVRVHVTVVARIEGGKSARSHIRLGGDPARRRKLEKDALRIVADGLVTRLSAMTRKRADE